MEGNLRFKIDWASLTVEGKFTVFALFYFAFEGNIPSTSPQGAYIWRGLFSEFYGTFSQKEGNIKANIRERPRKQNRTI